MRKCILTYPSDISCKADERGTAVAASQAPEKAAISGPTADEGGSIEMSSGRSVWAGAEAEDETATRHKAAKLRAIKIEL
jgi:hypothetical protein